MSYSDFFLVSCDMYMLHNYLIPSGDSLQYGSYSQELIDGNKCEDTYYDIMLEVYDEKDI